MNASLFPRSEWFLRQLWSAAQGAPDCCDAVDFSGSGDLPSVYAVSDLAAGSVAAAMLALSEWRAPSHGSLGRVEVDRRLASMWFASSLRPMGWALPPVWDAIAGDYRASDGWIRLHTNAPHHRQAALAVLGVPAERDAVANAVATWSAEALERAVVAANGCAAVMRSHQAWHEHPHGHTLDQAPLLACRQFANSLSSRAQCDDKRPLTGIRVLDLTRIIAGPVATRFLAAAGADVLRIDPPNWHEPGAEEELTWGKRTARLDLKTPAGLATLTDLMAEADVLVHGYRSDALDGLGLGEARRRAVNPGLVEVALDAYGWDGPWATRRGFDSLVQMSCGIAEAGMRLMERERPTPLPVQALDHAAGYLLACAALRGLSERRQSGQGWQARTSLASVAELLKAAGPCDPTLPGFGAETEVDLAEGIEHTGWGPARRLRPPAALTGVDWYGALPARPLGSDQPYWLSQTTAPASNVCSQSINN
ncbi:CoA transferase [Paludibacterium purpuratum]|uniref:CoA transferase family III n=1 Tax=Paludibacterium purpuratum TaxID=1144873 RepID=A0A4R7B248_9NEIS|nr:CoA transferase [Paludibacterium purpuratum]TDR73866.1 CoA transferase family III [Paludibacterium purpuratum]